WEKFSVLRYGGINANGRRCPATGRSNMPRSNVGVVAPAPAPPDTGSHEDGGADEDNDDTGAAAATVDAWCDAAQWAPARSALTTNQVSARLTTSLMRHPCWTRGWVPPER